MVKGGGGTLRLLGATKTPMCSISGCALLFQEIKKKKFKKVFLSRLQANMEVLLLKVDGVFYFSGICDVFFPDPVVAYFSGPFRVIITQTPFCYFQIPAFLASEIITLTFTNVN